MPLYEFTCTYCGHEFEKLAPYGTDELPCPNTGAMDSYGEPCGEVAKRREVPSSPPVAIFKACGFTRSSTCGRR
jgi:predicted nucleic acid-binding Zn ribbon protein